MRTTSISNILKCMNPQCTRVIVTRGARRWAGPEVPSEQIHKLYNPSSLPFSVACACGHYTISVMAEDPPRPIDSLNGTEKSGARGSATSSLP